MPADRCTYVPPEPQTNILDLDFTIFNTICHFLNSDYRWRRLIELADQDAMFRLSIFEVEECARAIHVSINGNPACQLFRKWASRGMNVRQLANLLRQIPDEASLVYLVPREDLRVTVEPPRQRNIMEGETLTISCEATGFPQPNYVWFRGQNTISERQDGRLTIPNIRLTDAGQYTCRIHHSYHDKLFHVFSQKCQITITPSPVPLNQQTVPSESDYASGRLMIIEHPSSVSVRRDQSFVLKCVADGNEPISYLWIKDGRLIPQLTGSCLQITQASDLNMGTYQCLVRNNENEIKSNPATVTLFINSSSSSQVCSGREDSVEIVVHPTPAQTHCQGGRAVMEIKVKGKRPYSVQWYHNGRPLPGATDCELNIAVKGREQVGDYQASVTADGCQPLLSRICKLLYDSSPPTAYHAHDKVALVIGTATYRSYGPNLPAVQHDLYAIVKQLRDMEFYVVSLIDLTLQEMKDAVAAFCDLVSQGVYVIFYCAGHGYEDDAQRHYLMPWDTHESFTPKECLCINDVEAQIQQKCPALLLFFLDVCRKTLGRQMVQQPSAAKSQPITPARANRAIFYASSSGQEAFEEKANPSAEQVSHGLFSRYFVESLQIRDIKVGDLFNTLQEKFRTCTFDKNKYPQDPELTMNIHELGRSLWDPIHPEFKAELVKNRRHDWDAFTVEPGPRRVNIGGVGVMAIGTSYIISNVLQVFIELQVPTSSISIGIFDEEVDAIVKPIRKSRVRPNASYFLLNNIQRLRNHLRLPLYLDITSGGNIKRVRLTPIDLGLPLVAPLCLGSGASHHVTRTETRQAVEHSDSECSLSDLPSEKSL